MDFKMKFITDNKNVWVQSVKPTFFSITGNKVRTSIVPYSMENAEHALVIFHYRYTVIEQSDIYFVALFFNSNGDINDYIEIDDWKLYFNKPITALNRRDFIKCSMTNGLLRIEIHTQPWNIDEKFERIWQLFSLVRTCKTQTEVDFVKKIYEQEGEILVLKDKNLKYEAKIDTLNMMLDAHKELISKLTNIVNSHNSK